MTVLQLRGPMGFRVLQWCHPMLTRANRTSHCTRIITLYGARKVDSGPRIAYRFHPGHKTLIIFTDHFFFNTKLSV